MTISINNLLASFREKLVEVTTDDTRSCDQPCDAVECAARQASQQQQGQVWEAGMLNGKAFTGTNYVTADGEE